MPQLPEGMTEADHRYVQDWLQITGADVFRAMRGRQQVLPGPSAHGTTRYDHNWEVGRIAGVLAARLGQNATLAIASGVFHDCGHPALAHTGEEAMTLYRRVVSELRADGLGLGEWNHAEAVRFAGSHLSLSQETFDIAASHSWSFDRLAYAEHPLVSIADRIAYVTSDMRDALMIGTLTIDALAAGAPLILKMAGISEHQLSDLRAHPRHRFALANSIRRALIDDVVTTSRATGIVGFSREGYEALDQLRTLVVSRIWGREEHREWQDRMRAALTTLAMQYDNEAQSLGLEEGREPYVTNMLVRVSDSTAIREACEAVKTGLDPSLISSSETLQQQAEVLGDVREVDALRSPDDLVRYSRSSSPLVMPLRSSVISPARSHAANELFGSVEVTVPGGKHELTVTECVSLIDRLHGAGSSGHFSTALGVVVHPAPRTPAADEMLSQLVHGVGAAVGEARAEWQAGVASAEEPSQSKKARMVELGRFFATAVGVVANGPRPGEAAPGELDVSAAGFDVAAVRSVSAFAQLPTANPASLATSRATRAEPSTRHRLVSVGR